MNIKIGNTPLVELKNLKKKLGLKANVFAKVEKYNPAGSIKDRVAFYMINDAIKEGKLKEGSTIIEPTSGNTGIGIAFIARELGYKAILTMPESMSIERRQILASYGAEIVLTPAKDGMAGAIAEAKELNESIPNSLILAQFDNPSNVKAHYETTGPEIYKDLNGKVDIFVAGVGTGGTVSGVGKFLKEKDCSIKVVAVEPSGSPVLSKGEKGPHKIQGIGAGFVPSIFNRSVVDEIITCGDKDAFIYKDLVNDTDNVFAGISSGAALYAACLLASKEENKDKNIVVVFPDGGEKYLSIKYNE